MQNRNGTTRTGELPVNRRRLLKLGDQPLRYQLITLFLLFSIIPSIGLGLLVNWTVNRIVERQVTANTLQLIGKVNQTLDSDMENLQNITYLIGFDERIQRFLNRELPGDGGIQLGGGQPLKDSSGQLYNVKQFLQGFTTLYPEIAAILVANRDGDYISNEMYARSSGSLTQESWYKDAVSQDGLFTVLGTPDQRIITSHTQYRPDELVTVARSLIDPDTGEAAGVVMIDLKLRTISRSVRDVTLGKNGYLMVMEKNGGNVYIPDHSYVNSIPEEWFEGKDSGSFTKEVDGQTLQFIFGVSSFTGWRTVGVFPSKDSPQEVKEIRFYMVSFLFLVCLFGLTASYLLSQSISRPIHQLMSFMQKAESGDLTVRYWGSRQDEIGMLGRSFNRMLLQIRKLIKLSELRERQKREAELRSLQAHIKPHFLYNTLDTIHWMGRKKGAEDISDLVAALSRLFRIGLSKGEDIIPIKDELLHISSYMQIQRTRYRDRLQFEMEASPEVSELYVLKLLLQPIVENAIYHGIKARRGPGSISLTVEKENSDLLMTVEDNGAGIPEETLLELRRQLEDPFAALEDNKNGNHAGESRSYGMLNVQARIRLTFGEAYGITLDSIEGEGTKVSIRHPWLHHPPAPVKEEQNE